MHLITFFLFAFLFLLLFLLFKINRLESNIKQENFRPLSFRREPQLLELGVIVREINSKGGDISLSVSCEVIKHKVIYNLTFTSDSSNFLPVRISWVRYSDYIEIKKVLLSLLHTDNPVNYQREFDHLNHLRVPY